MGVEVEVEGMTKSFGRHEIWSDVSFTLPPGEVSALLGPSGTGKSVFLKCMVGLLRPERGRCVVAGVDTVSCSRHDLYEVRKHFGVLFQDGALFGSMTVYDNVAFPLREHTRKSERQIRDIVMDRMALVGLEGAEEKLPGEISGGMKKRAGLARALVLEPEILLCDEPDSGLDPVRTAYLSQLLIDINARLDTTILIVTHNINLARTVPDNVGMLFQRRLVGFGPRELMLTSDEPVIAQFLNGRRVGPIGMSEEKDAATAAAEQELAANGHSDGSTGEDMTALVRQLQPTPGVGTRRAVGRRMNRLAGQLKDLPPERREVVVRALQAEQAGAA
ncbi:ABC transporter ATP-binding protein [Spongisporangium articulatum]|uniref:ABC transporter ATP-binding protein n=1 Tax=Spongisporangium articulatum TaxID=3362603 RepID=A0ABW8AVP2_9ACTN